MTEFQGMVGRSWLNKSVAPNSSTTQLSLSISIIVLSKSKITTISDIVEKNIQKNQVFSNEMNVFVVEYVTSERMYL